MERSDLSHHILEFGTTCTRCYQTPFSHAFKGLGHETIMLWASLSRKGTYAMPQQSVSSLKDSRGLLVILIFQQRQTKIPRSNLSAYFEIHVGAYMYCLPAFTTGKQAHQPSRQPRVISALLVYSRSTYLLSGCCLYGAFLIATLELDRFLTTSTHPCTWSVVNDILMYLRFKSIYSLAGFAIGTCT